MARAMRGRTALALIAAALLAGTISSANAAPTLDTTVPVPAVTITDVSVLGPSTVRVTTNVDTRNLDSSLLPALRRRDRCSASGRRRSRSTEG